MKPVEVCTSTCRSPLCCACPCIQFTCATERFPDPQAMPVLMVLPASHMLFEFHWLPRGKLCGSAAVVAPVFVILQQLYGVDLSLYRHRVLVMPMYFIYDAGCGWVGLGTLGPDVSSKSGAYMYSRWVSVRLPADQSQSEAIQTDHQKLLILTSLAHPTCTLQQRVDHWRVLAAGHGLHARAGTHQLPAPRVS